MRVLALVIGGADCWAEDLAQAKELCKQAGVTTWTNFLINDQIAAFPEGGVAITLHPDKLDGWLKTRAEAKLPEPIETCTHRSHRRASVCTKDWGGSSGLFAVKRAREKAFDRIILCGVPLSPELNHFVRKQRWNAAIAFRHPWPVRKAEIGMFTRSMSGWTADLLGKPTVAWLSSKGVQT